jgi:DNA polymerase bacteriophage-type
LKLHIDIETYSSIDLPSSGVYKYCESEDFEILLFAYSFDEDPVQIVDLASGEFLPEKVLSALNNIFIEKWAHNAAFERTALRAAGFKISSVARWYCTAVKSAYCGFPVSLSQVSEAMALGNKAKSLTGNALIRLFSCPVKPTKANNFRTRNLPSDYPEKWEEFKNYCKQDVEAEREIGRRLERYTIPTFERENYILDQKINDRGIKIDTAFAKIAYELNSEFTDNITTQLRLLTGLDNPSSPAQLKRWIAEETKSEINSLNKSEIPNILKSAPELVKEVLLLREKTAKTSVEKYEAMRACSCESGRAHGLFQFYGASRTGRWAGRLIQLQNLPQNHISDLDLARRTVASGDYDLCELMYDDLSSIVSQETFLRLPTSQPLRPGLLRGSLTKCGALRFSEHTAKYMKHRQHLCSTSLWRALRKAAT